jgi:hypothetical protein
MDDHPRSAPPFTVLLLLVAGVWLAGLLPPPRRLSRTLEPTP